MSAEAKKRFFLPEGYQINPEPRYENDIQDGGVVYQPEVYSGALRRIEDEGSRRLIVDVGCGRAGKLVALQGVKTIGIDFGPNVEYLQRTYPWGKWISQDLERELWIDEDLRGATVICADVVEHLKDPTRLLSTLGSWLGIVREVVISTPERDLHYFGDRAKGVHLGPPRNRCHVREWNLQEFESLLDSFGLRGEIRLTRTSSRDLLRQTIEAVCRKS